jgi:uncharacterized Fe-S center protein
VARVWFISVVSGEDKGSVAKKVTHLFKAAGLETCFTDHDLVAVKTHFGEEGNDTHIPPEYVLSVTQAIRERGGNPFLTDSCVLYKSQRDNAVNHLRLAHDHGFTLARVEAPVIIADGLVGGSEREVPISGRVFKTVSLSSAVLEANSLVVLSHVTGHMGTGMGGTIKNMGMGFASRKGKLRQHSVMKPLVSNKKCTGCGVCVVWCPEDAISLKQDLAVIDSQRCIGCGECLTMCRFDAIRYDWKMREQDLQQRMAEHALGSVIGKQGKVGCLNFLLSVTKDCDCLNVRQEPIFPDIGILASTDPVAIDAASLDLIRERTGKPLSDWAYPDVDPHVQIAHGESIGLGSAAYDLVTVV